MISAWLRTLSALGMNAVKGRRCRSIATYSCSDIAQLCDLLTRRCWPWSIDLQFWLSAREAKEASFDFSRQATLNRMVLETWVISVHYNTYSWSCYESGLRSSSSDPRTPLWLIILFAVMVWLAPFVPPERYIFLALDSSSLDLNHFRPSCLPPWNRASPLFPALHYQDQGTRRSNPRNRHLCSGTVFLGSSFEVICKTVSLGRAWYSVLPIPLGIISLAQGWSHSTPPI